jgi:hypothetical protein
MGSIPFQIGPTPNPNSIRVGLGEALFPKPSTYTSASQAEGNPLVEGLLAIPGVVQVFTLQNFISINKDPGAQWDGIEPKVAEVLLKHLDA